MVATLACSVILSYLDYCNAVLHGAPAGTIHKLQHVQNTVAQVILQVTRWLSAQPLIKQLHWLPHLYQPTAGWPVCRSSSVVRRMNEVAVR